jgi:hypothetical protein
VRVQTDGGFALELKQLAGGWRRRDVGSWVTSPRELVAASSEAVEMKHGELEAIMVWMVVVEDAAEECLGERRVADEARGRGTTGSAASPASELGSDSHGEPLHDRAEASGAGSDSHGARAAEGGSALRAAGDRPSRKRAVVWRGRPLHRPQEPCR